MSVVKVILIVLAVLFGLALLKFAGKCFLAARKGEREAKETTRTVMRYLYEEANEEERKRLIESGEISKEEAEDVEKNGAKPALRLHV